MKPKVSLILDIDVLCTGNASLFSQAHSDVNGDSAIDIIDALLVAQDYVGLNPPALTNPDDVDVNCDGTTDIIEAIAYRVQRYASARGLLTRASLLQPPAHTSHHIRTLFYRHFLELVEQKQ